jgi:hypothetical protein
MTSCKKKTLVLFITVSLAFLQVGCDSIAPGRTSEVSETQDSFNATPEDEVNNSNPANSGTTTFEEIAETSEETAETSETVEYYTMGTVEGRGWIGPLHYNVRGLPLGPIAVENDNLHRYDTGKYFGPGTFQIWGEAYNNAHDLADSREYSFGVMTLRILIRYEDKAGNIKTLVDSSVEDEHGQLVAPRFGPGSMEFNYTVSIPDDVKQTPRRSSVMIEISHRATWGSGGNTLAANLQFSSD